MTDESKTRRNKGVMVKLTEDEFRWLRVEAAKDDRTMSSWARMRLLPRLFATRIEDKAIGEKALDKVVVENVPPTDSASDKKREWRPPAKPVLRLEAKEAGERIEEIIEQHGPKRHYPPSKVSPPRFEDEVKSEPVEGI